jgi:hypothetical protein
MSFSACGDDEPAKKPEDNPPPTSYGGGGGGTDPDPDPDTSFGKPRPGPIYDSANGPELPAAADLDPNNPLVGAWKGSSEGYLFKADGTYEKYDSFYSVYFSSYDTEGWAFERGRYQTSGDQILFYNAIDDRFYTWRSDLTYRNKPLGEHTKLFAFGIYAPNGTIRLSITYPGFNWDPSYYAESTEEDWMRFTSKARE